MMENIFTLPNKFSLDYVIKVVAFLEKDAKNIPKDFVISLLRRAAPAFSSSKNVIEVNSSGTSVLYILGDTHGQVYDVLNIIRTYGYPNENIIYLCNGDYVDRGAYGLENMILLLTLKLTFPSYFFMLRGNHETRRCTEEYGFKNEIRKKLDLNVYEEFINFFHNLPLAAIVNKSLFVVHAGLPDKYGITIDEINAINRFCEPGSEGGDVLMAQMIWADPSELSYFHPSYRSFGSIFGSEVTEKFLEVNNLSLIIRSHEQNNDGITSHHNGRLITLFTAPNYGGCGNVGRILRLSGEGGADMKFIAVKAVPAPKRK